MSAMYLLPLDVQTDIAKGYTWLRADLLVIPEAEAAGWVVSFRNDSWGHPARFERGDVTVWCSGRDWRRRAGPATAEGKFREAEIFRFSIEGLRAALADIITPV